MRRKDNRVAARHDESMTAEFAGGAAHLAEGAGSEDDAGGGGEFEAHRILADGVPPKSLLAKPSREKGKSKSGNLFPRCLGLAGMSGDL